MTETPLTLNPLSSTGPLLLAIDIGNTEMAIGIFDDTNKLCEHWRLETKKERTSDELGIFLKELLKLSNIESARITGMIISNVVPPLQRALDGMAKRYFGITPLNVQNGLTLNIQIGLPNPEEAGADRIVNAVAAYARYKNALIVVDFGTATTFDYITKDGVYLGGVICPGPQISADALFQATSKLPRVNLAAPPHVLGRNTIESIQSGLFYGYLSMIDGLVERLKAETGDTPKVIATGGLATLFASHSKTIDALEDYLTLDGLALLYKWNPRA